jgi:hypothetical protein
MGKENEDSVGVQYWQAEALGKGVLGVWQSRSSIPA